jgi:hypothetical protein
VIYSLYVNLTFWRKAHFRRNLAHSEMTRGIWGRSIRLGNIRSKAPKPLHEDQEGADEREIVRPSSYSITLDLPFVALVATSCSRTITFSPNAQHPGPYSNAARTCLRLSRDVRCELRYSSLPSAPRQQQETLSVPLRFLVSRTNGPHLPVRDLSSLGRRNR